MKPFWVIQADRDAKRHLSILTDSLRAQQTQFVGCQLTEFSEEIEYLFSPPPADAFVIPYGSTKLTALARQLGWEGLFYDESTFCVDAWVQHRHDMLNQEVEILSVADVERRFTSVDEDEYFFIRPVADLKAFTGCVVSARELAHFSTSHHAGSAFGSGIHYAKEFTLDTACAVSSAKEIQAEYRFFIVDHEVVDGSLYHARRTRRLAHVGSDWAVMQAARDMVRGWLPHDVCVMDVAEIDGALQRFQVIEFNTFNSSGFYEHDIREIATAVTRYAAGKKPWRAGGSGEAAPAVVSSELDQLVPTCADAALQHPAVWSEEMNISEEKLDALLLDLANEVNSESGAAIEPNDVGCGCSSVVHQLDVAPIIARVKAKHHLQ